MITDVSLTNLNFVCAFQCLVYFKVHLLNRNKSRIIFQNVLSLDSLRPGKLKF